MAKSWKKRRPQRRPPLQNHNPEGNAGAVASGNPSLLVPSGIELTPIPPHIIQSVRDLLAARGVDVESMIQ